MEEEEISRNEKLNKVSMPPNEQMPGKPEITTIETFPISAEYTKFQLSSETIDALVSQNPSVVLKLIEENQRQQAISKEQEHEIEKISLQQKYELNLKKEENKLRREKAERNTLHLGIGAFCLIFAGVLFYSAKVDDKSLPGTIFTAALSAVAGGTSVALTQRSDKLKENNDDSEDA